MLEKDKIPIKKIPKICNHYLLSNAIFTVCPSKNLKGNAPSSTFIENVYSSLHTVAVQLHTVN